MKDPYGQVINEGLTYTEAHALKDAVNKKFDGMAVVAPDRGSAHKVIVGRFGEKASVVGQARLFAVGFWSAYDRLGGPR